MKEIYIYIYIYFFCAIGTMDFDHIGEMIGPVQKPLSFFLLEKVSLLVLEHVKMETISKQIGR
jgi:hypothetical protein